MSGIHFMVIAAHSDDAEIGMGGTIAKLIQQNRTGVILDLADSSAASNGNTESRKIEAENSKKILGVHERVYLGMKDASLSHEPQSVFPVLNAIRNFRPEIVFTHAPGDDHPDHNVCSAIVIDAAFKAGLQGIKTDEEAFRPREVYFFGGRSHEQPRFCVDITSTFPTKVKALRAYESQFLRSPESKPTRLNDEDFLTQIESRCRYWGEKIGCQYAEPFWARSVPEMKVFPFRSSP